jgi:hypothetical protein
MEATALIALHQCLNLHIPNLNLHASLGAMVIFVDLIEVNF